MHARDSICRTNIKRQAHAYRSGEWFWQLDRRTWDRGAVPMDSAWFFHCDFGLESRAKTQR